MRVVVLGFLRRAVWWFCVQLAAATAENRDLKNELNAFDPAFFDEIEDLKLSHHSLSSACGRYEELLRTYTARLGLDFQPLR